MASKGIRRIGKLTPIKTGNPAVDRLADTVVTTVNQLVENPLSGAVFIRAELTYGLNKVGHALGRAPVDFLWNTDRPGAVLSNAQADNPEPTKTLWVVMDGPDSANCRLVVF